MTLPLPTLQTGEKVAAAHANQLQQQITDLLNGAAIWSEVAPAGNPPANKYFLYFKSDGNLYKKNSSGVEAQVGGGGGGGDSFNVVDDADYTILDGDGYTDIVIEDMSAIRTVTLPTIADNDNRRIRIWHGDLSGGTDYKLNVTSESAGEIENSSTGATTIPLMSPGDNIELIADSSLAKWVIKSAHSKYRKAFYTYSTSPSTWSDTNDGTYIKREGFDVFLEVNATRSGNWSLSEFILTVDSEFRPPNTISKTAEGNNGNKEAITLGLVSSGILFISGFINAGNTASSGLSWRVL